MAYRNKPPTPEDMERQLRVNYHMPWMAETVSTLRRDLAASRAECERLRGFAAKIRDMGVCLCEYTVPAGNGICLRCQATAALAAPADGAGKGGNPT